MRVGDIAAGRAGDKGDMLDLTLVARDAKAYSLLSLALTPERLAPLLSRVVPGPVLRYELPGLMALKFVLGDLNAHRRDTGSCLAGNPLLERLKAGKTDRGKSCLLVEAE